MGLPPNFSGDSAAWRAAAAGDSGASTAEELRIAEATP